eukprot:g10193.t1
MISYVHVNTGVVQHQKNHVLCSSHYVHGESTSTTYTKILTKNTLCETPGPSFTILLENNKGELVTGNAVAELFARQYEKQLNRPLNLQPPKCLSHTNSEAKHDTMLLDECFSEMEIQKNV